MTEENIPSRRRKTTALPEGYITKAELARRVNRTKRTIDLWQQRNLLPSVKAGPRLVVYHWPTVRELLKELCPELCVEQAIAEALSLPQPSDARTQPLPLRIKAHLKQISRKLDRPVESDDLLPQLHLTNPCHKGYTELITGSTAALRNAQELADALRDALLAAQGLVWVVQYAIAAARGRKTDAATETPPPKALTTPTILPTTTNTTNTAEDETKGTP